MAEILTVTEKTLPNPIKEANSSYYYNGYIYINTASSIYKFDYINDTLELVYNKTVLTQFESVGKDNYIYIPRTSGRYLYIQRYDINTNTITSLGSYDVVGSSSSASLQCCMAYLYQDYPNRLYFYCKGSYVNVSTYVNIVKNVYYDVSTNSYGSSSQSGTSKLTYSNNRRQGTYANRQYVFNYNFDGYKYFYYTYSYISPTYLSTPNMLFNAVSVFYRNGNYYLVGGQFDGSPNDKIYTFNDSSRILTDTGLKIPSTFIDRHIATVDNSKYYAFTDNGYLKLEFVNYSLDYNIKTSNGLESYVELTNQSPITKVRFGLDNGTVNYIITTLSGVVTGSYTSNYPEGKILIGYSSKPNSTKADFELNKDIDVSIYNNFDFYEVYGTYKPPATTFSIDLYKNSSEMNRVDKTIFLESVGTLFGAFRGETSITDMAITIESVDFPNFNYVYISIFNRYYFVTDIKSIRYGLWEISLSIDVLMSYKDSLRNLYGFVDRNENESNENVTDTKRVVEQGYDYKVDTVQNELFVDNTGDYVLTGLLINTYTKEE